MRVSLFSKVLLLCMLLFVQHSMGDDCPFTCSTDSDCQWVAENVGASQTCEDGCCVPSPDDFDMEGDATSAAATARLTVALLLLCAFVAV
jgi:hypothetical protein